MSVVQMQLSRIIISEISDNQVIYLKEVDGDRQFPILIGIFEATSIERRVKGEERPMRPLTHDLAVSMVKALGGELDSIVISELKQSTYYAVIRMRNADGDIVEVDSRPSDAIAIAVTVTPHLPIFVSESVLNEAGSN